MKRFILLLVCLVLMLSFVSMPSFSAEEDSVLVLPEDDGSEYPVTGVVDEWYSYDETIKSVVVPENVVRLGDRVFYECENLAEIQLNNKLQRIGAEAFVGTAYYENEDNWVDGVLYIGDALIKARPEAVTGIYTVRAGTRIIADEAFKNCENLSRISIPDTVEYIGEDAFSDTAFFNNKDNWNKGALILNHVLLTVDKEYSSKFTVPEGIKTIADCAFENVSSVTEVTTPDSLVHIGLNVFRNCESLSKVSISKNVETLGRGPFRDCNKLKEIIVDAENNHFTVIDGVLYTKDLTAVVKCPEKKTGKVSVPKSVTKINAYAFQWCEFIEEVTIPEGVVFIGESAFAYCSRLTSITIPESVEYIARFAFAYCNGLTSVVINDNVEYLGGYAFTCCMGLQEVTIGDGVKEINSNTFEYCENLSTVKLGDNIKRISRTAFRKTKLISDESNYEDGLLIVSDCYLVNVSDTVTDCIIPDGIILIADGAFDSVANRGNLQKIIVPNTIRKFNKAAFAVVNEIPVYYDDDIFVFAAISEFNRNSINLYTNNLRKTQWIAVSSIAVFVIFVVCVIVVNIYRSKQPLSEERSGDYVESENEE